MAYIISEDAKELLKDVKEFCQNEIVEQAKQYDITGEWPREIYEKAIEMQLHMMDIPEEYGGLGLSHIDQAAIVEQIAWADAGVAVTLNGNGLALKPVLVAGSEEQKQKCCDIIANGGGALLPSPSRMPAVMQPTARLRRCGKETSMCSTVASALSPMPVWLTSLWSPL